MCNETSMTKKGLFLNYGWPMHPGFGVELHTIKPGFFFDSLIMVKNQNCQLNFCQNYYRVVYLTKTKFRRFWRVLQNDHHQAIFTEFHPNIIYTHQY